VRRAFEALAANGAAIQIGRLRPCAAGASARGRRLPPRVVTAPHGVGSDKRPRWRQFDLKFRCEAAVEDGRTLDAFDTVGAAFLFFSIHGTQDDVAVRSPPQRIRLDRPSSPVPLFIAVVEIDQQMVGGREADHFDKRCASAGDADCTRRAAQHRAVDADRMRGQQR